MVKRGDCKWSPLKHDDKLTVQEQLRLHIERLGSDKVRVLLRIADMMADTDWDFEHVPLQSFFGATESLTFGNGKHGKGKRRAKSSPEDRLASLNRHILAYVAGDAGDPESGLHPLKHAAMQLAFLMELECK